MNSYVSDFLDSRIEDIIQNLKKNNSEYAIADERSRALYYNIEPILNRDKDITISACDRMDFCEFLEQDLIMTSIIQKELYKQGYIDCVRLLSMLKVIS